VLAAAAVPGSSTRFLNPSNMTDTTTYDAIIIGGSYAGLSAAMGLGRALRKVLVIDGGKPCNRQTPHAHNFLTGDGETPQAISAKARHDVAQYATVTFYDGLATSGKKSEKGFAVTASGGEVFNAKKLVFTTGIKDIFPDIKGFAECWGISIVHCPYCHGYEIRNEKTGVLGNGDYGWEFSKLINNWTNDLTLFTNGPSELLPDQSERLLAKGIRINEKEITALEHTDGRLDRIKFNDGTAEEMTAVYAKVPFRQNTDMPLNLGCEINEMGYLTVDAFQRTNVPGVYAAGDNCTFMRSVANAVSQGAVVAGLLNKELVEESF